MSNLSTAVRNAQANQLEGIIGASAKLLIFSGAKPTACADADPSGLLATLDLPADWLTAGANGVVSLNGSWAGTGSGAGTAQSFRIKDSGGATCHVQGTAGATGSGMEMILVNAVIAVDQPLEVTSFTWTQGNS